MRKLILKAALLSLCWYTMSLLYLTPAYAEEIPDLSEIPADLSNNLQVQLTQKRRALEKELADFQSDAAKFNAKDAENQSDAEYEALDAWRTRYIKAAKEFNRAVAEILLSPTESDFFYALQTRTLTRMRDGGHPIDAPGMPPVGMHGLVGGTTWTFGFKWPHAECGSKCTKEVEKRLMEQLKLYCTSQSDPKCLQNGLPFTKENYDFVLSMGSSHSAIEDLATRAYWDGAAFGEFSRQNKEIFASLKGRQFDTLDCHSNGAMLCLAALRSGETTAKVVRLFGPQINPRAAALWRDYAANTGAKINIYINNGDPVAAASWMQPTPETPAKKAATAVWLTNPITGLATISNALFHTWLDSKKAVMDETLKGFGFEVKRFGCSDSPNMTCHSMLSYERKLKE
ncbi:MAG: hypothetical protein JJE30_06620 [Desulfuromonadales bacterium]|nr:hypothetical protein [Desulfuromonadales bacterium]